MTMSRATRPVTLGLVFLALVVVSATAQTSPSSIGVIVDQVLALFPKVDGDILEANDKGVTLAIGKKDGLAAGIELNVYREGRELRHPKTGAVLGRTEEAVGRVVVQEVFEGYSTARVSQGSGIKAGDRVRVSAGKINLSVVPLVEGVKDPLAEAALQELTQGLNRTGRFQVAAGDPLAVTLLQEGLQRQEILEGKGLAKLAERYKVDNALVVHLKSVQRKPYMDVRLYGFPGTSNLLTAGMFVPPSVKPAPKGDFSASSQGKQNQTAVPVRSLLARLLTGEMDSGAYSTGEGSIPLKEVAKYPFVVTSLDVAIAPADKIARMVITDGRRVYLYRIVERVLEAEWTWTADASAGIFAVQLADLNEDGVLDVVVNRYHPNQGILLKSTILTTRDGKPAVLASDVPQILLAMDTTGDGLKKALWGQDFVQAGFFKRGAVDRLVLREGALVADGRVQVPSEFRATGATMSNINGKDGLRTLTFIDDQNRLRISAANQELWRSSSPVGGGVVKLVVETQVEKGGRNFVYFAEPNPVAIDLDGDGIEEIVVVQNQVPGRMAVVFKGPAGYRFQSVNSGFEGTITGLGAIPGDPAPTLVVAVTRFYGLLTNAGDTQIIMTVPE
ncbi:MAG TPA: VCBS repeat-containing protein [Methylomirabilota bacterium]|nr:VCBS repeat-containing protein [Methylomirabilota bacterium]